MTLKMYDRAQGESNNCTASQEMFGFLTKTNNVLAISYL